MNDQGWTTLQITLHIRSFYNEPPKSETSEQTCLYEMKKENLAHNRKIVLKKEGLLDYVVIIVDFNEDELVIQEAMLSSDDVMNLDGYESAGVLIIHQNDIHKTPVRTMAYNQQYWYEVTLR